MAVSLAVMVLLGLASDYAFRKLRLPGLVGMLIVGVLSGPYVLDILSSTMMEVSSDFRMIALIVILLRAGLKTRRDTLNRVGKTAALMGFLPSVMEGLAIMFAMRMVFHFPAVESAIAGFVIAAVSPAVVVPSMINLIEERRGTAKGIPTLILAASSLDNVFVIVVFSAVLGMASGKGGSLFLKLLEIPVSIFTGVLLGAATGYVLYRLFRKFVPRATKKGLIVIGVAILFTWIESRIRPVFPFSSLAGVMAIGFIILELSEAIAHKISQKLGKIWIFAEILLFVLVGAQVNIHVALDAGLSGALVIAIGLIARSIGTYIAVSGAGLSGSEKLFCVVSYIPKATVQAAIGAVPLAAGVEGGEIILALAVLSILLTAPIGAIGINYLGRRVLEQEAGPEGLPSH